VHTDEDLARSTPIDTGAKFIIFTNSCSAIYYISIEVVRQQRFACHLAIEYETKLLTNDLHYARASHDRRRMSRVQLPICRTKVDVMCNNIIICSASTVPHAACIIPILSSTTACLPIYIDDVGRTVAVISHCDIRVQTGRRLCI